MASSVLKHDKLTLERIEKFISKTYFTDCNLFSKLVLKKKDLVGLRSVTCESIVSFEEVLTKSFEATSVGESFGASWKTVWFKVDLEVPKEWRGHEVSLMWECEGEATVWRDGQPVQGLSVEAERTRYTVYESFQGQLPQVTLYIEMSCNALFGLGQGSLVAPPDPHRTFKLNRAELVVLEPTVKQLLIDFELLWQIAKNVEGQRGKQALFTANEMINVLVRENFGQDVLKRARKMAGEFFGQKNGESQHTLHAVGHCHLDTAWLWPVRETVRKCCRSFSTILSLMDKYPTFTFACSQAQQLSWMKEKYPGLFVRIQQRVKEGRFKLTGGVWVEMDANMPSGESLIRQFLVGQKFFQEEFNVKCNEFWLPDTFGYSAQLPQIIKGCGMDRFVTQKLSWNFFNKFPHHTFWWHGIDDSTVLVHFPPGDSYAMTVSVPELLKTVSNSEDQGRTNHSLFLFGFGDGGQGPTEEMLEKIERLKDVDGLPKIRHSNVETFFEEVSRPQDSLPYQHGSVHNEMLCHWKGELFLELHHGTYTTQAKIKRRNRQAEALMYNLEFLFCVIRFHRSHLGLENIKVKMDEMWRDILLNQFHDILPGSSIAMVYQDAHEVYDEVFRKGDQLWSLLKDMTECEAPEEECSFLNTMAWKRTEVVEVDTGYPKSQFSQPSMQNPKRSFILVQANGMSLTDKFFETAPPPCRISREADGSWLMTNDLLRAKVDRGGRVTELYVGSSSRNALKEAGNQLVLYDDVPLYWDAWDVKAYHLQTGVKQDEVVTEARVLEEGRFRVTLEVELKIGLASKLVQKIVLDACCPYLKFQTQVDWKESHKLLKVEFATSVLSRKATYDIQFGCLERPNHSNTSWDMAQYEVCGHKWADLSEEGYGVAVLNDCKYGWSCLDNRLCLSLLRSPKNPDAEADIGVHDFVYAIMPHQGRWQEAGVVQAAYNLNNPFILRFSSYNDVFTESVISISNPAIVLSAFKPSERGLDHFVVRLFESHGGCCDVTLTFNFTVQSIKRCNMLEECLGDELNLVVKARHHIVNVSFKPFQIITFLLKLDF